MRSLALFGLLLLAACDKPAPPGPLCPSCKSPDVTVQDTRTICKTCGKVDFAKKNGTQPPCASCQGTGYLQGKIPSVDAFVCKACSGSGISAGERPFTSIAPPPPTPPPCKACAGKGQTDKGKCGSCGGTGKMPGH